MFNTPGWMYFLNELGSNEKIYTNRIVRAVDEPKELVNFDRGHLSMIDTIRNWQDMVIDADDDTELDTETMPDVETFNPNNGRQ